MVQSTLPPGITTLAQPTEEIGRRAFSCLLERNREAYVGQSRHIRYHSNIDQAWLNILP